MYILKALFLIKHYLHRDSSCVIVISNFTSFYALKCNRHQLSLKKIMRFLRNINPLIPKNKRYLWTLEKENEFNHILKCRASLHFCLKHAMKLLTEMAYKLWTNVITGRNAGPGIKSILFELTVIKRTRGTGRTTCPKWLNFWFVCMIIMIPSVIGYIHDVHLFFS